MTATQKAEKASHDARYLFGGLVFEMCGRFTQVYTWQELVALYRLTVPAMNLQPRHNIASTTTIDAIIPRGADRLELAPMRWGALGCKPPVRGNDDFKS